MFPLWLCPVYISIGQAAPNGKLEKPPAPLFPEKVEEEEIEEEIEVPGEGGAGEGDTDQGGRRTAPTRAALTMSVQRPANL